MEELIETGLFSPVWEHLSLFTHTYDICHAIIHSARFLYRKGTICLIFHCTICDFVLKFLFVSSKLCQNFISVQKNVCDLIEP